MVWGKLSLVLVFCGPSFSQTGYVDRALCASCHPKIAADFAKTGMANSFQSIRTGADLPEFKTAPFTHTLSAQRFTPLLSNGKPLMRREETGPTAAAGRVLDVSIDYILGSGSKARSYLHRTPDNRLTEVPVTWYSEAGGHWDMSPGYDRAAHEGFSREITDRCLFCHNGYPRDGAFAEGIDCQRCHGPGASHVKAAREGRPARGSIVNPAKLTPQRAMDVCMQCHLETTSSPLPGEMLRPGRQPFSFQPGEPLSDFMLYFDHAPGMGYDDKFEIVSSAYRLRQSKCFQADNAKLACTACHNPHVASSRAETLARTRAVCTGCHAATPHTTAGECVECHMPTRRASDVPHAAMTDHRIGVARSIAVRDPAKELPYTGAVLPYLAGNASELELAVAQIRHLSNFAEGMKRLEMAIETSRPAGAWLYFEAGQACLTAGQNAKAEAFFAEAVKRSPGDWKNHLALGIARHRAGHSDRAIETLRNASRLAPAESAILLELGSALADPVQLRLAVARNPENSATHAMLGNLLLRTGDVSGAERALQQAVRLRPELLELRINLAAALIKAGKYASARAELETAILTGPSPEKALSAWFTEIGRVGDRGAARAAYEHSLQTQIAPAHANLGAVLGLMSDTEGAIREFRAALDADPESDETRLNLAQALLAGGEDAAARPHLERALQSRSATVREAARKLLECNGPSGCRPGRALRP